MNLDAREFVLFAPLPGAVYNLLSYFEREGKHSGNGPLCETRECLAGR